MVTFEEEDTVIVVTLKLALDFPALTVTLAGTVASELLLDNVTVMPPLGAGAVRVTVPVVGLPPMTVLGFRETEDNAMVTAGVMVSGAVLFTPL